MKKNSKGTEPVWAHRNKWLGALAAFLAAGMSPGAAHAQTVLLQGDQNTSPNFNSGSINTGTIWTIAGNAPGGAVTEPTSSYAQFNAGATSPGTPSLFSQLQTSPTTAGSALTLTLDISSITNSNPVNEIPYWGFNTGAAGNNILVYDGGTNGWSVFIHNTSTGTSSFYDLSGTFPTRQSAAGTYEFDWSTGGVVIKYNGGSGFSTLFDSSLNTVTQGANVGTTTWNIPTVNTSVWVAATGGNAAGDDLLHLSSAILETAVPEPTTVMLIGTGLTALALRHLRRRRGV